MAVQDSSLVNFLERGDAELKFILIEVAMSQLIDQYFSLIQDGTSRGEDESLLGILVNAANELNDVVTFVPRKGLQIVST